VHSEQVLELVRILDDGGYRGDYSFEVFNDDYRQISLATVAERARNSVKWIAGQIGRRTLPQRRSPAQAG
jgi:predicted xylose isomerase-like sugar epimerase